MATTSVTTGTKYHNQTDSLVSEVSTNRQEQRPRKQLIQTSESAISDQAIDVSYPPGAINARIIKTLRTPSGMKPVICLLDEDIDLNQVHDYLPSSKLPEEGFVWGDKINSLPGTIGPKVSIRPIFSTRTTFYQTPFTFYSSHVLVRMICKPALSQSQAFWVSRSEQTNPTTQQQYSEIGFSWIPSNQNEIFILMPWFNANYVVPINEDTTNVFGNINVTALTNLVFAEGNQVPLEINLYFAPYEMTLYVPKPVPFGNCPQMIPGSLDVPVPVAPIGAGPVTLGTLTTQGGPTYIHMFTYRGDFSEDAEVNFQVSTAPGNIGSARLTNPNIIIGNAGVVLDEGTYTLTAGCTAGTFTATQIQLRYVYLAGCGAPPSFVQFKTEINEDEIRTKEIQKSSKFNYESLIDNDKVYLDGSLLPEAILFDEDILNPISRVSNAFNEIRFKTTFRTKVISQAPDIVCYILFNTQGQTIFKAFDTTKKQAKLKGYLAILEYYDNKKIKKGEEQINEYHYNPNSKCAEHTYGVMPDHSTRENHHDMFTESLEISAANKNTVRNVQINLSTVLSQYPYVNTREYERHYLKSNLPNIKIRTNKNPYSNLLCRVVLGTFTDYNEVMQMPGLEWDPTITDMELQPYWYYQTPAVTDIIINLSVVILSGQIDDTGMQLMFFFDTTPLKYHHKIDYDPSQPANAKIIKMKDFMNKKKIVKPVMAPIPETTDLIDLSGLEEDNEFADDNDIGYVPPNSPVPEEQPDLEENKWLSDPFNSLSNVIRTGSLQIGETLIEEHQESGETRSENKLEGVQMETSREHISPETAKVQIEKDFHFVTAITLPLYTATEWLSSIAIPINHNLFGKMEVTSAKKYKFWSGEPTIKVTATASSLLNGVMYLAQVNPEFDIAGSASSSLRMYPRTHKIIWDQSLELPLKWYNPTPQLPVRYTDAADFPQLGYLILSFPNVMGATFAGGDNNIKITISACTSNLKYSRASYGYENFDYPGVSVVSNYTVFPPP